MTADGVRARQQVAIAHAHAREPDLDDHEHMCDILEE